MYDCITKYLSILMCFLIYIYIYYKYRYESFIWHQFMAFYLLQSLSFELEPKLSHGPLILSRWKVTIAMWLVTSDDFLFSILVPKFILRWLLAKMLLLIRIDLYDTNIDGSYNWSCLIIHSWLTVLNSMKGRIIYYL